MSNARTVSVAHMMSFSGNTNEVRQHFDRALAYHKAVEGKDVEIKNLCVTKTPMHTTGKLETCIHYSLYMYTDLGDYVYRFMTGDISKLRKPRKAKDVEAQGSPVE